MAEKRKWYNIKKKAAKRWTAYQLKPSELKELKSEYEYRGPFKSLVKCMIVANI